MTRDLTHSYSSLALHRKCPQAFAYRYFQRLSPGESTIEQEFGQWWHALRAANAIERGTKQGSLRFSPYHLDVGNIRIEPETFAVYDAAEDRWKQFSEEEREIWVAKFGGSIKERLWILDARWHDQWAEEIALERPIAVEVKWEREINGQRMVGIIDEIYEDTKRGLIVVRDNKTSGKLPTAESGEDLLDSQLHIYPWGAAPMLAEWGLSVHAVGFDRTCTTPAKEPQLTATGTLSKSVTMYDLRTYTDWVGDGRPWGEEGDYYKSGAKAGQPKFGTYTVEESVVEKLSSPASASIWHQRTLSPLNRNIIMAHLVAAKDTAKSIAKTEKRWDKSGEAPRNFGYGCRFCDFATLCRAELIGGAGADPELYGLSERS